ncbi:hypothetical protein JOD24_000641 [Kroppenstedtia sanguinis]|uniref:hypothetical protein n=1 Tax=Kroppenstedtia sanguinis TaxID=1380684 RepID=UPI003D23D031
MDEQSPKGQAPDEKMGEEKKFEAWWRKEEPVEPLPKEFQSLLDQGSRYFLTKFERGYELRSHPAWFWTLYLDGRPLARQALHKWMNNSPYSWFTQEQYRYLKAVFKLAEQRRDAEVWGRLAHQFDLSAYSYYGRPYSSRTDLYLRRRVWRVLRNLGREGASDYTRMAAEILIHYHARNHFWGSSRDDQIGGYLDFYVLNQILYRNSSRFVCDKNRKWRLADRPREELERFPEEREEAFPELWDRVPERLWHILVHGKAKPVIQFAIRALKKGNPEFFAGLNSEVFLELLEAEEPVKRAFAADEIIARMNPDHPEFSFLLKMLVTLDPEVRNKAFSFVEWNVSRWSWEQSLRLTRIVLNKLIQVPGLDGEVSHELADLLVKVLGTPLHHLSTLDIATQLLNGKSRMHWEMVSEVLYRIHYQRHPYTERDLLPFLKHENETIRVVAKNQLVLYREHWQIDRDFLSELMETPDSFQLFLEVEALVEILKGFPLLEVAGELLESNVAASRELAASVLDLLGNSRDLDVKYPVRELLPFLSNELSRVRGAAQKLVRYPYWYFQLDTDFVMDLLSIPDDNHLRFMRDCFAHWEYSWHWSQLLSEHGDELFQRLWARMTQPETPDSIRDLIREEVLENLFRDKLNSLPMERILPLLESTDTGLQELGVRLLNQLEPSPDALAKELLFDLAHSRVAAARETGRRLLEHRLSELASGDWANLAETDWEDTREWVFWRMETEVPEEAVDPDLVCGLADSSFPEVRQQGLQWATLPRMWPHRRELVQRLGESPFPEVQLFALEQAGHLDWGAKGLKGMELFFRRVLFQVNGSRKAKDLALELLWREGAAEEERARLAVHLLQDYLRNAGKRDFEKVMVILTRLSERHPGLDTPLGRVSDS